MRSSFLGRTARSTGEVAIRHFSGAVLSALLLFFCTSARLARYEIHKPILRLASTQAYLDGEELRKELSKTKPRLFFVGAISLLLPIRSKAIPRSVVISSLLTFEGFSPHLRPRSPPAR